MKTVTTFFFAAVVFLQSLPAQEGNLRERYERAVRYLWENLNNKTAFNLEIEPHWFPDSSGLWFIHHEPGTKRYRKISLPDLAQSDLFDHRKVARVLSDSLAEEIQPDNLPITRIEYKNPVELIISVKKKKYLLNTKNYTLTIPPEEPASNEFEAPSPDKKWIAFSKDYNLYIRSAETGEIRQLSHKGKKGYEYASWYGWADIMKGENGERPKRFFAEWSEDSQWIYTTICDLRSARKMYLLDWSVDTLYRPVLLSYYRGSPGDTAMVYIEPVFFHVASGKEIKPDLPRATHINQTEVAWSKTPGKVYLLENPRGYKQVNLYIFDLNTGQLNRIYSETSKTNIDNFRYYLAEKSGLLLFLSEKSGWRQLYSIDLNTLEERPITKGNFYINSIDRIDENGRWIYFRASGKEKGRNPYHQHLYRVSFTGKNLTLLTPENCHHRIAFSPDGQYLVDNYSTVTQETRTVLRSASSGKILTELGRADVSLLVDQGWKPPEVFSALAHDGKTTIYGAMWKPTDFDPKKRYPIIDNSYTGPHTQVFPKEFSRAFAGQALAELGFIVIQVDGLGSAGRSKKFHDYSYKNLG